MLLLLALEMKDKKQYGSVKAKTLCQSQFFLRTTETQRALRE